jgi:hypothetical protein
LALIVPQGANLCCCSNLWLRGSSSIVAAYARQWIVQGCIDAGKLQQQLRYEAWLAVKDVLLLEEGARKPCVEPARAALTFKKVKTLR